MARLTVRFALLPALASGALLVRGALATPAAQRAEAVSTAQCLNTQEAAFLAKINAYRQSKGLKPLAATKSLNAASWSHSYDMGAKRFFSHTGSDGSTAWDRMARAGYTFTTSKGENIAASYATADAVFAAWKASSGHNADMLNPNVKAIGIGFVTVSGSPYTNYWTTDSGGYGTPPRSAPSGLTRVGRRV